MTTPYIMAEEYWANTQLSVVRHFGRIKFQGYNYVIVNKEGKDIFECSREALKEGRDKAIEPGEPCDLCREDLVPAYRQLGRDEILSLIREGKRDKEIKAVAKAKKKCYKKNK